MRKVMVMMSKYRRSLVTLLSVFVFLSYGFAGDSIFVRDAWINEAPPNARVIAGYMTIENRSSETMVLTGVSSEHFKRIEIHRTEMHGDMMKMVQQEELGIPAGGTVSLQPGSYHLMLVGPESVPRKGETVSLVLHFDNGQILNINSPVRAAKSSNMHKGSH